MLQNLFKKAIKLASISSLLVAASSGQSMAEEKKEPAAAGAVASGGKLSSAKMSKEMLDNLVLATAGILGPNSTVTLIDPRLAVFGTQDFSTIDMPEEMQ